MALFKMCGVGSLTQNGDQIILGPAANVTYPNNGTFTPEAILINNTDSSGNSVGGIGMNFTDPNGYVGMEFYEAGNFIGGWFVADAHQMIWYDNSGAPGFDFNAIDFGNKGHFIYNGGRLSIGTGFTSVAPPASLSIHGETNDGSGVPTVEIFNSNRGAGSIANLRITTDNYVSTSTPPASINAANLDPGTISFYLDEVGNNLKVKVKYSNGTVKTGTVALV